MLDDTLCRNQIKKTGVTLDRKVSAELLDAYYEELKHYADQDFEFAMAKIRRYEKRFPPPSVIHEYISRAITERVEADAETEKRKEAREVENFKRARANDPKESDRNKARAREIIEAISQGKTALDKLTAKYHKENREAAELQYPPGPTSCLCDTGTVLIRDGQSYTSIAACSICGRGNPNLAQVDPATLELKRDINYSAWRSGRERE